MTLTWRSYASGVARTTGLALVYRLCTVRYLGTFLTSPTDVPPVVVLRIAAQLGIADPSCLLL